MKAFLYAVPAIFLAVFFHSSTASAYPACPFAYNTLEINDRLYETQSSTQGSLRTYRGGIWPQKSPIIVHLHRGKRDYYESHPMMVVLELPKDENWDVVRVRFRFYPGYTYIPIPYKRPSNSIISNTVMLGDDFFTQADNIQIDNKLVFPHHVSRRTLENLHLGFPMSIDIYSSEDKRLAHLKIPRQRCVDI